MVEFSFLYPRHLFFLLIIPLLIFFHFLMLKGVRSKALSFANFEAISRVKGVDFFSKNISILFVSILIVFACTMALAGLTLEVQADTSDYAIVLAIDTSQSMEANDFSPSRLEAAKEISMNFVRTAPFKSRFGVVAFSGSSLIVSEVSDDLEGVADDISSISLSRIGGTDLFEAIVTSSNLLREEESRAIILFSDGQINVGTVEEAISYARDNNVIVHTVAMGTSQGGETSFGVSKLDEQALSALAFNTDGEFFSASDKGQLSQILDGIFEVTNKKVDIVLTKYILIGIIFLFVLEYILLNARYKGFP